MKKIASMALLVVAGAARAGGPPLLTPVTYDSTATVQSAARDTCDIEGHLATDIGAALGGTTTSTDGEVARVTILGATGIGGGAVTGPKTVLIRLEVLKDGAVVRMRHFTRRTRGGLFGAFKHVCTDFESDSQALAKDVARWVAKADSKATDDPPAADDDK